MLCRKTSSSLLLLHENVSNSLQTWGLFNWHHRNVTSGWRKSYLFWVLRSVLIHMSAMLWFGESLEERKSEPQSGLNYSLILPLSSWMSQRPDWTRPQHSMWSVSWIKWPRLVEPSCRRFISQAHRSSLSSTDWWLWCRATSSTREVAKPHHITSSN